MLIFLLNFATMLISDQIFVTNVDCGLIFITMLIYAPVMLLIHDLHIFIKLTNIDYLLHVETVIKSESFVLLLLLLKLSIKE